MPQCAVATCRNSHRRTSNYYCLLSLIYLKNNTIYLFKEYLFIHVYIHLWLLQNAKKNLKSNLKFIFTVFKVKGHYFKINIC